MAAVLSRNASTFRQFHRDLNSSPINAETTYDTSLFERYPPASFAMHEFTRPPYHSGLDSNSASQPYSSSASTEACRSIGSMYSSSPPSSQEANSQSHLPCALVSPSGMIAVLDYTPSEGEANTPVTVNLELRRANDEDSFGQSMISVSLRLRLIFGCAAVRTTVDRLFADQGDRVDQGRNAIRLRLHANAPPHSEVRFAESRVPVSVQAMDGETKILETFTFGTFLYWAPATIRPTAVMDMPKTSTPASPTQNKRKREEDDAAAYSFPPESKSPQAFHSPKKAFTIPPHVDKGFKLVRTTNIPAEVTERVETQQAELEWVVDGAQHPNSLDKKWSAHELAIGRRLIRFHRELSRNVLRVSCEVIPQEAYDEEDIVISCVYRQETRNCWFTSVDVIYLLERLVGGPFSVEEKNRIRRNLEGFKPTTVSKTKGGFEMFFQRIMDFPPPKPRNIEKDVKVFSWSLLVPALEKIIAKYSVVPANDSEPTPPRQGSSSQESSNHFVRPTKAASSRSSTYSQGTSEDSGGTKPLMSTPSHQPLRMVVESPPVLQADLTTHVTEPDSVHVPTDHYYFPELSFPDDQQWRRHESISSLGAMPTHTNDYFVSHEPHELQASPGALHTQAFSNPFASDVNFGTMSLGGHGTAPNFDGTTDFHGGANPSSQPHAAQVDPNFTDDVFDGRRSSLANDLLYPMSGNPPNNNQDAIAAAYGAGSQDTRNVPHEFLYSPFQAGSQRHLALEDEHSQ